MSSSHGTNPEPGKEPSTPPIPAPGWGANFRSSEKKKEHEERRIARRQTDADNWAQVRLRGQDAGPMPMGSVQKKYLEDKYPQLYRDFQGSATSTAPGQMSSISTPTREPRLEITAGGPSMGRAPLQPGFQPSLQPNLPTSLTGHSAPVRGGHGFLAPRGPFQFPPRGSSRPFVGRSRPSAPPSPYQANATFAARQDPNMSTTNYRPVFYPTHSAHIPVSSHDNISGFDNRMHGLATPNPFEHPIPIPASTPTRPSFPIPGPSAAVRASLAESAAAYGWQSSANNTIDRNENEYSGSMLTRLIKDPATPNRVSRAIPIIDPNRRTQMGPRMTEGSPVATRTGGKESAEESDSGEEGSRKHERSVNA